MTKRTPVAGGRTGRIRLVALDLDGTLVGDDLRIRPRPVAAVRAAVEAGGLPVFLVTLAVGIAAIAWIVRTVRTA